MWPIIPVACTDVDHAQQSSRSATHKPDRAPNFIARFYYAMTSTERVGASSTFEPGQTRTVDFVIKTMFVADYSIEPGFDVHAARPALASRPLASSTRKRASVCTYRFTSEHSIGY